MAIKLDMQKAYDKIKWYFIKTILTKLGFYSKWIGGLGSVFPQHLTLF